LEGPKATRVEVEGKNEHDKGIFTLPSMHEVQEKSENEPSEEPKFLFPKPHMPPCHFHKDLLKLNLILNLASF